MEKKDSDKWSSSSTKSAPHHGLCDVIPRGSLEMSEDARQFVVADPLLVEHVKYSVSSNGRSESGSEAQYLYPVCAICARHRPKELISSTSRTRRTCPRHTPQTVLSVAALVPTFALLFAQSVHQWNHTRSSCLCNTCATPTHVSTDETQLRA